jgi:adenine-specific DNA-methyltransferase
MVSDPFYRLWVGDAVELCKQFPADSVDCVITDPPYGSNNQSNSARTPGGVSHARKIANDSTPEVALEVFYTVMDQLLPKTKEDSDLYIFTGAQPYVLEAWLVGTHRLANYGFRRKGVLVWNKTGPGMGDLDSWAQGHEYILFFKKGRRPMSGPRRSGVLSHQQIPAGHLIHPHEKPEILLEELLLHSTDPGDLVVDPFGGSSSLARACRNRGRSAVTIELDPHNHDEAVKKFNNTELGLF